MGVGGRVKEGDGGFVGILVVTRGQGGKMNLRFNNRLQQTDSLSFKYINWQSWIVSGNQ